MGRFQGGLTAPALLSQIGVGGSSPACLDHSYPPRCENTVYGKRGEPANRLRQEFRPDKDSLPALPRLESNTDLAPPQGGTYLQRPWEAVLCPERCQRSQCTER